MLAGIDVNANKKAADEKRAEEAAKARGQDQEMQLLTNSDSGKDDPNQISRNKRKHNDMGNGVIPNKQNDM